MKPMELMVEASPRRILANTHTYHINSDQETYFSADDLRINIWHLEITDKSFNIVYIKPTNMEELTEVITAAEFHPVECNLLVCDMRSAALCDRHSKLFEETEDPATKSFFSEIISSISDMKLSNSGRYMISRLFKCESLGSSYAYPVSSLKNVKNFKPLFILLNVFRYMNI